MIKTEYRPQFFTATILEWKKLLHNENYKLIIIDSLRFLVQEKRVVIYAYVIMNNHLHLIWQAINGFTPAQVQHSFLRYTVQQIKFDLHINYPKVLKLFKVNAADREFQIWERNPLSVDLYKDRAFLQKLEYIHENPVVKGYCDFP